MAGNLLRELKRRHVFRATGLYLLVAWGVLQLADIVVPALNLPEWVVTAVLVILVLCFPLAVVMAWVFDLTPHGLKRSGEDEDLSEPQVAPAASAAAAPLRFGDFELDPPGRELRRRTEQVENRSRCSRGSSICSCISWSTGTGPYPRMNCRSRSGPARWLPRHP